MRQGSEVVNQLFGKARNQLAAWFELSTGNQARLQSMEGLRGLAILLVFFCHYYDIIWQYLPAQSQRMKEIGNVMMGAGGTGVDLFFVLSGFLIYGMVLRPGLNARKFYTARARRIYPAFLAVFLFYVAASPFLHLAQQAGAKELGSRIPETWAGGVTYVVENLAFLPGIFSIRPLMSVAWSLSYEWLFYLLIPVLVAILALHRWRRRLRILLFLFLAGVLTSAIAIWPETFFTPHSIETSHVRAIMFVGGILVFEILRRSGSVVHWKRRWEVLALAAFLLAIGWRASLELSRVDGSAFLRYEAMAEGGLFLGYSLLTLVVLTPGTILSQLFSWAPLRWLGNISYSFYLLHGVPMHAFTKIAARVHVTALPIGAQWLAFVFAVPFVFTATAICCAALFLLVEKPMSLAKRSRREDEPVKLARPVPSAL
jgi:exopolysaccharide production protein ExoZ